MQRPLPNAAATAPARPPLAGRRTRVALVGTGYIADTHLAALRELAEVEVVALCDVALERARAAAARHRIAAAVGSVAELAPLAPDVVHLCVPPDLHVRVARECIEHGFSVLAEKPLALDGADAAELFELARARGLVLGANHNSTFHPAFRRLLRRLESGEIGRVEHVDVHLAVPLRQLDARDFTHWMFREPRNIVLEQGVHPFAQLVRLLGRPLAVHPTVLATRELAPGQPFHERWAIAARCERGTAQLHFAFGATFQRSTLAVRGTDGVLEADLHRDTLQEERKTVWLDFWDAYLAGARRARALRRDARANLLQYLRQTLRLAPRGDAFYAGMRGSLAAFHAAYRAGTPPPGDAAEVAAVLAWCAETTRDLAPAAARPAPRAAGPARTGEVVVLGAGGFIGRHTLRALLARGAPVTAGMRRARGLDADLEAALADGRVRLVRADLGSAAELRAAIRGATTVLHLATGGGATWEEVERAMVAGTRALGEACLEEGVGRLVYVSSIAALYLGPDCGTPVVGDAVSTDPRPAARALYARGKAAAEHELLRLHRERGLRVTIARPGVVMGPDTAFQHSGLGLWVRDNHCVGWGPGDRPLPLVLVEDVADALARIALAPADAALDGRAANLAARVPLSAAELVAEFARRSGRDVRFHPRPLAFSQALEIGKWLVKRAGGRSDAFPSYRDLKSRSLWPALACETARGLGWRPCEERSEFLARLFPGSPAP